MFKYTSEKKTKQKEKKKGKEKKKSIIQIIRGPKNKELKNKISMKKPTTNEPKLPRLLPPICKSADQKKKQPETKF